MAEDTQKIVSMIQESDLADDTKQSLISSLERDGLTVENRLAVSEAFHNRVDELENELNTSTQELVETKLEGVELTEADKAELKSIQGDYEKEVDAAQTEYQQSMQKLQGDFDKEVVAKEQEETSDLKQQIQEM